MVTPVYCEQSRSKWSIVETSPNQAYVTLDSASDTGSVGDSADTQIPLRFVCHWGNSSQEEGLGVGFVCGGNVTLLEAREDGLELSRILGGVSVSGVYNRGRGPACLCFLVQQREIEELLRVWEEFFTDHPEGKFIQYFYGNGGNVVDVALAYTEYARQIVVVGINPSQLPGHEDAYYYCYSQFVPKMLAREEQRVIRLPERVGSIGGPVRFSDPTFVAALQYPYQCQRLLPVPKVPGEAFVMTANYAAILGEKPEEGGYYVRVPVSKNESPELFYKAYTLMRSAHFALKEEEHWTENRFQHWLGLWISCLRVLDGALFLIGQGRNMDTNVDMEVHVKRHLPRQKRIVVSPARPPNARQERVGKPLSDLIFIDGGFLSVSPLSNVLPVRKLPFGLYPMGITPSGEFTEGLYGGSCNSQQTTSCPNFPFGKFPDETFPYETFFKGWFSTFSLYTITAPVDEQGRYVGENITEKIFQEGTDESQVTPYGIQPDGTFPFACTLDLKVDVGHWQRCDTGYTDRPGWKESICKKNRERYRGSKCRDFDYGAFFKGELHPRVIGDHLNSSDDSRYLFPGGIFPNGSFPNRALGDEYPYGRFLTPEFNHTFPYELFFKGAFVPKTAQLVPMTSREFLLQFDQDIYEGWGGIWRNGGSRSFHNVQDLLNFVDELESFVRNYPWNSETIRACLFSAYWGLLGVSQCVVLHPSNGSVMRVIKRAARAFSVTAFFMNIADLVHSSQMLWWPQYPKAEVYVQSSLVIYSSVACFNDLSQHVFPGIRNQLQRVTKLITKVQAQEEGTIKKISANFRRDLRSVRKIIHLFFALLCASAFLIRFHADTEFYTTRITRAHDAFHSLGFGVCMALLVSTLFAAYC